MGAATWVSLLLLLQPSTSRAAGAGYAPYADNSLLYDWGVYGAYPQVHYESLGASSPWPNVLRSDPKCDDGLLFMAPRGRSVQTPGPMILDQQGNLVWMNTEWGQAMDVKVQSYQGEDYITFWHGTDNGTFGMGYYLMLDSSYEVFKKIVPVGDFTGDLHEFRITDHGTALMTIYEKRRGDLSAYDIADGWLIDSLFQEVDIATGELLFQWRASDHFAVAASRAPIGKFGRKEPTAFDFFHINSIDQDAMGNYLVSSRYMCAVVCIDARNGQVLWQLGGAANNFTDLSDGAATSFSWQHHASWVDESTISVFDNGAYDRLRTSKHSSGLVIALDIATQTAELKQSYVSPQKFSVGSQGSVQTLRKSGNVLVGWGHTPAFTEFSSAGKALCDVHIGAVHLARLGWCKNYRTFKYPWVGKPKTRPTVVVKPKEGALYVSWNGATQVDQWRLQSSTEPGGKRFADHEVITKESFETKFEIPKEAAEYVRVAAMDLDGTIFATSMPISRYFATEIPLMKAPSRGSSISISFVVEFSILALLAIVGTWYFRSVVRQRLTHGVDWVQRHRRAMAYGEETKYEALPLQDQR
ncbi:conserved hypothetical protein [Verticillium alfalfae VaMs.102]|uniref:Arylsulfotransferase n=1 Tax=Verticillium alfalfae (strain VaMs.102 / ATCC MYA-4576 / FGSC 10136) TaxID=526221 RepID=C9SHH9_VERA1|nr:conserved hypothetical protein [Verticillium alfalfae VaMs.102]EEY18402.1 conserved hypothetical protein [Verticillium alfalfae VaMs.102]